jgi:AAA domain
VIGQLQGSWQCIDLLELAMRPTEPPTIGGLLYPGKRTVLSGETESLKTWLALILAKAEMDVGHPAVWADMDAMGAGEVLSRLRALGAGDEEIAGSFHYFEPQEPLAGQALAGLCELIRARDVRLAVFDAFNAMLSLHGLDPNSTPDVEAFWREVATPLTVAGAAVVMLDHVVKDTDKRGKYAYGSERKASGAIVHVGFRLIEPLRRGTCGIARLTTQKDRLGFLPRPTIGRLVLSSDGEHVFYRLETDRRHAGTKSRPSCLMEEVSSFLATCEEPVSRNEVERNVTGKAATIRTAIDALVEDGYASQQDGKGKTKLIGFVQEYRKTDHDHEAALEGASEVDPGHVPTLVSTPSAGVRPCVPPLRGTQTHPDAGCVPRVPPGSELAAAVYQLTLDSALPTGQNTEAAQTPQDAGEVIERVDLAKAVDKNEAEIERLHAIYEDAAGNGT